MRTKAAHSGAYPGFVEPCHPTLVEDVPPGKDWIHEIKSDGYRLQVHLHGGRVRAFTRRGVDWSARFAPIVRVAERLDAESFIIDGEAVGIGDGGKADYQTLLREIGKPKSERLAYYAFDLLYLDGEDLRRTPLIERKRRLERLLRGSSYPLIFSKHLQGDSETIYRHACDMGLEGIVSKRVDSRYVSGRNQTWLKMKCTKSGTYPIVAFVEKLGAKPRKVASLYIGRWDGDRLDYAGKARSGYTEEAARALRERLDPLIVRDSPLATPIDKPKATWVKPIVEAEIQYSSVTEDGILREAVFKGLREDLADLPPPVAAKPKHPRTLGVPRENILQLLPDAVVPSPDELAAYWRKVWKRALPYLGNRPLKLVRHVNGTTFYHKGPLPPAPSSVHQLKIQKREGGEGTRFWVDDLAGFLGLVEIGVVELHPWNARVDDFEHPDVMVLDLDPGSGVPWEFVVETALRLRDVLKADGMECWPKLTGGKGIHVMVPLKARMTHDRAHALSKQLAARIANDDPDRYTLAADPRKREDRVFIDYLRNGRGTTAVGTWSPRVRVGFPIAAPVTWKNIERGIAPDAYSIMRLPKTRRGGAGA